MARKKVPDIAPNRSTRLEPTRPTRGKTVVGTNKGGHIQAVTTRQLSVFASRFPPELEAEELAAYLGELLQGVTCEKITTEQKRYSSFKVTAICEKVSDIYNEKLWPDGVHVRRYFEARKPAGKNATLPKGGDGN